MPIVLLAVLASCSPRTSWVPDVNGWFAPTPMFMRNIPDGNDSYSVGFRDSCNTYLGIIGVGPEQLHGYQIDNSRVLVDAAYNKGMLDGRSYCTHFLDPAIN